MKSKSIDFEKGAHEWDIDQLLKGVRKEFDGPIYRSEEDLEAIRNSDAPTIAVAAEDQSMIGYVPREEFLKRGASTKADDIWDLMLMPPK